MSGKYKATSIFGIYFGKVQQIFVISGTIHLAILSNWNYIQNTINTSVSEWAEFNVSLDSLQVISGTIFTGQVTQPTASKRWRKPVGHLDRLQSHQNHSTVLQYELG